MAIVLGLAYVLPSYRERHIASAAARLDALGPAVVLAVWGMIGVVLVVRSVRGKREPHLVPMLAGLGSAAILAGLLAAAQLLPVLEFTRQSGRAAGEGPTTSTRSASIRSAWSSSIWPNVFGTNFSGNRHWLRPDSVPEPTRAQSGCPRSTWAA